MDMKKDLKIEGIQARLVWNDKAQNKAHFETFFEQIAPDTHIVLLPETFNTGFSLSTNEMAERIESSETIAWMAHWSRKMRKILAGSLLVKDGAQVFNRFIWMQPDGQFHHYDKRHLFGFAGEDKVIDAGNARKIVQVNGWKINLQVCYDLRFPIWARQPNATSDEGTELYDMMIYIANWPSVRISAWDILLKARAIENQSYVIGINRVGPDGNNIPHNGNSAFIDPFGNELAFLTEEEGILSHTFRGEDLDKIRRKIPFLKDRDQYHII